MKTIIQQIVGGCVLCLSLMACSKDNTPVNGDEMVPLSIEFDNIVGGQDLVLNTAMYTNNAGETFSVTQLQYFVSNISLRKTDGTIFTVNQDSSYFLIKENDPSTH